MKNTRVGRPTIYSKTRKAVGVTMDYEIVDKLTEIADAKNVSLSKLINDLVVKHMGELEWDTL